MKASAIVFAGLITIIFMCVAIMIFFPYLAPPSHVMIAEKLSNKPEQYFVISNADPVLLQAITHLGEPVRINFLTETEIDDLISQHGTSNVEYQNSYYNVNIPILEPPEIYAQAFWICLLVFVTSTTLLISLTIFKVFKKGSKTTCRIKLEKRIGIRIREIFYIYFAKIE